MNDEIPNEEMTGVDAVDKILSSKFRKSADISNPTFSKAIRDTGSLRLREDKESREMRNTISPSKTQNQWLNKSLSEQASDDASPVFNKFVRDTGNLYQRKERSETIKTISSSKTSSPMLKRALREKSAYNELSDEDKEFADEIKGSNKKQSMGFNEPLTDDVIVESASAKADVAKETDPDWLINAGFDTLASGAEAFGKVAKKAIKNLKSDQKTEEKTAETKQSVPSSSATTDAILAEAAKTNDYGIYGKHEYNESSGRHELHFYRRDGKRLTHKDVEYLLTPTQIKILRQYAEYAYAGKIPSAKKRTVLSSSSNPNTSTTANTGAPTGTSTGNPNHKYTKWETTKITQTKAGLVGSPKIRQLTQAKQATGITQKPATTALAGKKDASGSITGKATRRDAFGSLTDQVTGRDASGSIIGTTNRNFIGVNNRNVPTLNRARNAEGSIAGASGNAIGYDAVKTINNPNRTRQATIGGLTQRRRATNPVAQPISAAQGAVNLSHVVTPSAINRQTVAQEQAIQQAQELQFNAGTRVATKSAIKPSRQKSPSRIVRNNRATGEVNTTRPVTKNAIKPSRQKSPSKITRRPAQVTKSAINKAKSAHYSKIVTRAIKDANLVEAKVGRDAILIDEKELSKSGLKTKSRTKKPSAIKQRAKNASPSQLKQPKMSIRYCKIVRRAVKDAGA